MTTGQIIAIIVMLTAMIASGAFIGWDWWRWHKEERKLIEEKKLHDRRR
jgi:predicted negative regulator of RcsB-dependent stress response